MQTIEFVHLIVRHKIPTARVVHPCPDSRPLFFGKVINATPSRFNFASNIRELLLVLFGPVLYPLKQRFRSGAHARTIAYP